MSTSSPSTRRPATSPTALAALPATLRPIALQLEQIASELSVGARGPGAERSRAVARHLLHLAAELERLAEVPDRATASGGESAAAIAYLAPRELQVLRRLAIGASTGSIATELRIAPSTVRSYVKSMLSKLGVHSRVAAVALLLGDDLTTS
jgi:DNA-binding NarL/FixJ family response regulator